MVEEPSIQSIDINNENESGERVLDVTSIADFATNDIDHSNQIELSIYPVNSVDHCRLNKNNVNDSRKFPSKKSLSTIVSEKSKNNSLINQSDLRRKYVKLNRAYKLKCEEVKRLKSCLNLYLNGVSMKKKKTKTVL